MPDLSELLLYAVEQRASDLHVKPNSPPMLRRDGHLREGPWAALCADDTERFAAAVVPPGQASELAATGAVRVAWDGPGRFRVHVFRQHGGVALAFRIVPQAVPPFDALGLPPAVRRLGDETRGLVVVGGPAGSGRTTTAAAILDGVNATQARHIVTVEDPIEIVHAAKRSVISQRQVGADVAGIAAGLSAAVAQDADVIFVGVLRTPEEVAAALAAAAQDRLVVGVVDATDTAGAVEHLVERCPSESRQRGRASLARVLRGCVCQRLLERADGKGRIPAVEVLLGTGRVADAIAGDERAADLEQIMAEGEYHGMQTFDQSLFTLHKNGLIGLGDALAAASHPHDLRITLQQAGLDGL